MNISKTQWIIISIVGALAIYYFFIRKTKMTVESNYREGGGNSGLKKCDCTYLGKGPKMCSKSVKCNDCCAGSGGGQE